MTTVKKMDYRILLVVLLMAHWQISQAAQGFRRGAGASKTAMEPFISRTPRQTLPEAKSFFTGSGRAYSSATGTVKQTGQRMSQPSKLNVAEPFPQRSGAGTFRSTPMQSPIANKFFAEYGMLGTPATATNVMGQSWKSHLGRKYSTKRENYVPITAGLSPHEVLGIPKNAPKEEAKRAYRKLMFEHHPDTVEPKYKEAAEESAKLLNQALENFQKPHQINFHWSPQQSPQQAGPTNREKARAKKPAPRTAKSNSARPYKAFGVAQDASLGELFEAFLDDWRFNNPKSAFRSSHEQKIAQARQNFLESEWNKFKASLMNNNSEEAIQEVTDQLENLKEQLRDNGARYQQDIIAYYTREGRSVPPNEYHEYKDNRNELIILMEFELAALDEILSGPRKDHYNPFRRYEDTGDPHELDRALNPTVRTLKQEYYNPFIDQKHREDRYVFNQWHEEDVQKEREKRRRENSYWEKIKKWF